ncbi:aminoacyl-tRNA hydrolase [Helicobacter zhangjianzhongii]|uniref:Aminoacyl-tRNA hydrolase n=1 Tax=Helicobacter zhangjianzhongii TaxID=2974574 RepID=A0ACC6FRK8_9HELI|nr:MULTISPECIES: aminoacyl-tRNA hydrolase [unclassified Helicobacter]MDL0080081.1 aminoacyl-tRNA hydrolase [Helicobacter sp. CPD2-1]MDL0081870.1 aminoacyl-tRNA hydrolase [Helicobacter sp. XJK30-2]
MPAHTKHLISTIQSLPISRGSARSLLAEYLPQIQKQGPLLIAGLGNPGEKYAQNRHNIGFIIIDRLCECLGLEMRDTSRFHAHIATLAPHIHIAKPQTFMNHSGSSIAAITSFYKINQLCIAHDELDLPLSTIRYKLGGSSGGHNGLKSIDSALHRQDYVRLRFGIKEAPAQDQAQIPKHKQVIDFVLGDFTLPHTTLMELVDKSVRGLLFFIITRDFAATQSHFSHSTKSQSAASKHPSPRSQAHAIATRATKSALFFPLDSSPNVKNVESTFENVSTLNEQAKDSRENAASEKTPQAAKQTLEISPSDSKISRLESGLLLKKPACVPPPCTASLVFKPRKEIRLGRLSRELGDEIHDSSPKAESPQQKVDSSNEAFLSSSRDLRQQGVAIHRNNTHTLESTFDKNAQKIQKLQKVDSSVKLDSSPNASFLSLRADEIGVAIHKSAQADSKSDDSASAEFVDCHAVQAPLAMTENNAASENEDSRNEAKNLNNSAQDSRENAQNIETPQNEKTESVFDKNLVGIDENAGLQKVDSSDEVQNLTNSAQDSRILELESGFFKPRKEIRLECLSTQRGDEIHDSSPKAESTQENPTPTQSPNYAH